MLNSDLDVIEAAVGELNSPQPNAGVVVNYEPLGAVDQAPRTGLIPIKASSGLPLIGARADR
ncbi:hypothetical protein [Mycobacterium sp. 1423905.2]|uniref:hypothetical protein n=1 Tax=Mycobacterium sp. 1423905.2 TaxID=1856859 RepID=UPI000800809D|nr:hypothetical protein [Mycobacterium sp. 1423905.2]OBJ49553.1 hypothetical protein A9W95_25665 [Mycobacterium sp. 1423905.2]